MKIVVLDYETLGTDIDIYRLEQAGELTVYKNTSPTELAERIKDADILVSNKIKYTPDVLKKAGNLKLICVTATGYDNVDIDYCRDNAIAVCNIKGYSTQSVAQVTVSMVLALATKLKAYDKYVSSGDYVKSGVANRLEPVFHELGGKVWGLIGYGNIGKKVAEVAKALGCRVLVNKKSEDKDSVSIKEVLTQSDIITIHVPLNCETERLIDEDEISLMKKNVIFVNTSRGKICNEYALARAVLDGKIGGLGIDVYSKEPFDSEHLYNKIAGLDNVILTPHMAWGALEARNRCIEEIVKNIEAFKRGEKRNRVV